MQCGQGLVLQWPDFECVEGLEGIDEIGAFVARQGGDASARAVSNCFVAFVVDLSHSPVYNRPSLVFYCQQHLGAK